MTAWVARRAVAALWVAAVAAVPTTLRAESNAQVPPVLSTNQAPSGRLRVYLDCRDCFSEYLRDQLDWVDFVRQPQDADVTVLSSSTQTGGGGREVVLRFVGRDLLAGVDRELRALSEPGESENRRRDVVHRTVMVGLLGYLAERGLPAGLQLAVESPEGGPALASPDPWNLWVFRIRGNASYSAEESSRESRWSTNLSADRVTEAWKFSFGANVERERERFNLDEDVPFEVRRREQGGRAFAARSLGPHWSVGASALTSSSSFGNTRFRAGIGPTVEFSVFPYRDYATRRLVARYEVGVERVKYNEITLFDKLQETLAQQEISARTGWK